MNNIKLSYQQRKKWLNNSSSVHYDLIVIGGGITGAGIALDAASRGLKVILLEKNDFGWGTSSRSTKLIHGGLRYLKQLEFMLVRNVGRERRIAYQNAPYLVHPEKMLLPLTKKGSLNKIGASFGLWLYDLLAGVEAKDKRKMLSKEAALLIEPLLKDDDLLGAALYSEYRTDDARLVIELLKTAAQFEAHVLNYVAVHSILKDEKGKATGVNVKDIFSHDEFTISGEFIVNAAGPWVDEVRKNDELIKGKHLKLSKGIHLVFPYHRLPVRQSLYFDVSDGRMIFCIPREGITYVGTTDTFFEGDIDKVYAEHDDVEYLLAAIRNMFPQQNIVKDDVVSTWAGLRPLIYEEGKSPSELSRKDEIFISDSGLISIAGGKLTGYRLMAKKIVDLIFKRFDSKKLSKDIKRKCFTDKIPFHGYFNLDEESVVQYIERQTGEALQIGATPQIIRRWVHSYGKATEKIIEIAYTLWPNIPHEQKSFTVHFAEIKYAIENEMVLLPDDFWIRRTGALYFNREAMIQLSANTASFMFELLNIEDENIKTDILNRFKSEVKQVINF
jgi:glycerol-3-phosphate dehydrogenase